MTNTGTFLLNGSSKIQFFTDIWYSFCWKVLRPANVTFLNTDRDVARGVAEGARAPPEFGRSVNPIQTRGGRLCFSHYCQPPRIQKAICISVVRHSSDHQTVYEYSSSQAFICSCQGIQDRQSASNGTGRNFKKYKYLDPKVSLCIVVLLSSSKQLVLHRAGLWNPLICTS